MKYTLRYLIILVLINFSLYSNSQEPEKNFYLSGYISNLQNVMFDSIQKSWAISNLIHNRINIKYIPVKSLTADIELRNRFLFGENITNSIFSIGKDYGLFDLTKNVVSGNSYKLNINVDRLNLAYEQNKLRITLGRQRINWGQTLVWNPNDIFNTYSFFDFDYVERPGSDALRLQYFNSEVSSTELAAKLDNNKKVTSAILYKFNIFEYDFQFLGGVLNGSDYVAGAGWSGAIKNVAFRGELSYFQPVKHFSDTTGEFLASISADYTFSNSFTILAEYLYCGSGINFKDSISLVSFYNAPQNVKNLSILKHNFVLQLGYPVTPLLNINLAGMLFPGLNGYYLGPSVIYSLSQNLDASFYYQLFSVKIKQETQNINLVFLRIKLNF